MVERSPPVAVVGSSGFLGTNLVRALAERELVAIARDPGTSLPPSARAAALDVADTRRLTDALVGVGTAYYLVHSMRSGRDFAARDARLAASMVAAADAAGIRRIVYVGSLGDEALTSRRQVGETLARTKADFVEFRAGMIIGHGSVPFEMLRRLVDRLRVLALSPWAANHTQPLAVDDMTRILIAAETSLAPGRYSVVGPDVVTFEDLVRLYAAAAGRKRRIIRLPIRNIAVISVLSRLVLPFPYSMIRALSHGLTIDTIAPPTHDEPALPQDLTPKTPLRQALHDALAQAQIPSAT